jgi:homocysteine S-methyltransferase
MYPILLDGGLSNQLESQGCDLNHHLWSAKLLADNPEALVTAHLAYLKAGAQCIITSSYQASIAGFMKEGHDVEGAKKLILLSVEVAIEAKRRFLAENQPNYTPLIAASIGAYGAFLADGSEYRGNYGVSDKVLRDFHQSRIDVLDASDADFFACETIPSFQEAKVLAKILKKINKSAWISFSCNSETTLNDGTSIATCAAFLGNHPNIFAIGVNCTAPKYISGLIKSIKKAFPHKKIVVYPNSGEVYHAATKTWSGFSDPTFCTLMAREWLDLGADIVGGCCRMGTEHIEAIGRAM